MVGFTSPRPACGVSVRGCSFSVVSCCLAVVLRVDSRLSLFRMGVISLCTCV